MKKWEMYYKFKEYGKTNNKYRLNFKITVNMYAKLWTPNKNFLTKAVFKPSLIALSPYT